MTPVLVRQNLPHAGQTPRADLGARARDWSEIQERMLVPLYEAVYERLDVGPGTRLLSLGSGSGLALVMAASRGAALTGVESSSPARLALARERLPLREDRGAHARADIRLTDRLPTDRPGARTPPYTLVTAFEPIGRVAGDTEELAALLAAATPLARRGAPVVLVGWGPPERCATTAVLRVAAKAADQDRGTVRLRPALRDDLEDVARRAGLRPDGSGRVACPFGYADVDSALKGLLSTGLLDAAVAATDQAQVEKETAEALHPYLRPDGTVWMPNVFRYLIARIR
ncbi:SAM-dependent methyltransferase [Streptomyces sp. B4I13]|uniref:SAM-dependent methyltransferase n=1 Tax=Streptomyces sp. B4I13 TaxID=3042271 RepID=UPI002785B917|nr:SAM-dependent methyltransferase [Streptomyces sp. B4I13]MDQ0958906.1 SAM-dependent methyltransferase [Streptomyces sp. B4I13]